MSTVYFPTRQPSRCCAKSVRWASGAETRPMPNIPTRFENKVAALGLRGRPDIELYSSRALRLFAEKHRHKHYIPETLLLAWGLQISELEMNLVA